MRSVFFLMFAMLLMTGCSKDEVVGFTSLLGSWTYATPDEKIKVTFDIIGGTSDVLSIQNQIIFVDGIEGKAVVQTENVAENTIGQLRINANDAGLTFPYNIIFENLKANDDFSIIDVEEATYTWPWQTINSLSAIQIVRK